MVQRDSAGRISQESVQAMVQRDSAGRVSQDVQVLTQFDSKGRVTQEPVQVLMQTVIEDVNLFLIA